LAELDFDFKKRTASVKRKYSFEGEIKKSKRDLFKTEVLIKPINTHSNQSRSKKISFLPDIKIKFIKSDVIPQLNYPYSKEKIAEYNNIFGNIKPPFKFKK